ncbi:MAG: phosphate ABC transporter permease, partial [Halieaceae bacterium]|nr:phosphate ABC transporter permease [Halieaceae bacterium]
MSSGAIPGWWPRWRRAKDKATTFAIATGGSVVLLTILMLFVFLVYEVAPLLQDAKMEPAPAVVWQGEADPWLSLDEYAAVAFSVAADGSVGFTRLADGAVLSRRSLRPPGARLTSVAAEGTGSDALVLGFSDGSARVVDVAYRYDLSAQQRRIIPVLAQPLGDVPVAASRNQPVHRLALDLRSGILARQYDSGELEVARIAPQAMATDLAWQNLGRQPKAASLLLMDAGRWLLLLTAGGDYQAWPLSEAGAGTPQAGRLFPPGESLRSAIVLQGSLSLVAASDRGALNRYYLLRAGTLAPVHRFDTSGMVPRRLLAEHRRRGFLAFGDGEVHWYNATSGERGLRAPFAATDATTLAISPRAHLLLALDPRGGLEAWHLDNPHPEVSLASLWREIWYEGYDQPALVYQSSASSNDYEPKFSLTPLAFGTLKAAFYAMLFATPLAICAAIYTAFFMAPVLRRRVKPLVELMEALPTVILGFLAGLWLAPMVEDHLAELLSLILVIPGGVLLFSMLWALLPSGWRSVMPDGWHAIVLLPVILGLVMLALALGDPLQVLLFNGDARRWFSEELGLAYDQRNAIVVGIAMGFAVIP